jgi:hypothetical protein
MKNIFLATLLCLCSASAFAQTPTETPTATATATASPAPTPTATATPTASPIVTPTGTPRSSLQRNDALGEGKALDVAMLSVDNGVTGDHTVGAKFNINNNYHMVKVMSKSNLTTLSGEQTIDGYGTGTNGGGTTVLLTGQTTATQKGPWITSSGAWTRPTWWENGSSPPKNSTFFVQTGDHYAGLVVWLNTSNVVVGTTTPQTWSETNPSAENFVGEAVSMSIPVANITGLLARNLVGESHFDGTSAASGAGSFFGVITAVGSSSPGIYDLTLDGSLTDADYGVGISVSDSSSTSTWTALADTHSLTTTALTVYTRTFNPGFLGVSLPSWDLADPVKVTVTIYHNP